MSGEPPLLEPKRKLFFGLFIFPLVITVGMGIFLCAAVLLTHEQDTPENLIAQLKKSSPSKRWQKAFELSNELNRNPEKPASDAVLKEIISVLADKDRYDAKTRSYMALALARFKSPDAEEALVTAASDSSEEVRVHSVWALASMGATNAIPEIRSLMKDESASVRKISAYALGGLSCKDCVSDLKVGLKDEASDVRWNSALALARLGDGSGADTLMGMLERDELENRYKMNEPAIEAVMTNALKGLALIKNAKSAKILASISKNDKNMRVRQTALTALESFKGL